MHINYWTYLNAFQESRMTRHKNIFLELYDIFKNNRKRQCDKVNHDSEVIRGDAVTVAE